MRVNRFCPSCEKWWPFGFHSCLLLRKPAYNRDVRALSNKPVSRTVHSRTAHPKRYKEMTRTNTRSRHGKAL
jgi:hypothetical protein